MPRAPKACPLSACPKRITENGRCEDHQPVRHTAAWTKRPGSERVDLWTADLRTTFAHILDRDNRRCYICGGLAWQVDHVIPAFLGGMATEDNLRAICGPCHARKSSAEGQEARRRG